MSEQVTRVATGVELCWEAFGDPADPPVLLVMGLATQMLGWDADFCAQLAGRGFRVVRFDNRDIGRSTKFPDTPPPTPRELALRRPRNVAYTLDDLAADAGGLLDALGLAPAHVVGVSMGGMVAQLLAAEHPAKVRSLVSIMSNTGSRLTGQPALSVMPYFLKAPATGREARIQSAVDLFARVGSPGFERDEAALRGMLGASLDRDDDSAGAGRQLAAIMATGDRTPRLRSITAPTLVVHGTKDRLVRPSGAKATAKAIPGARVQWVEGMGHDLPRGAWPQLLDGITAHCRAADEARAAGRSAPVGA